MILKEKRKHKINGEVRFPQVRVIGDDEPILMSSHDAFQLAKSQNKDLILINENQTIPIVKIEEYNRFLYKLEKSEKEKKKNSVKSVTKEVQLSPELSDNDIGTKSRKSKEFLEDGNKVKVVLQLKGRQKSTPERGQIVMLKFFTLVQEIGVAESLPKLEGSKWHMMIKPKKK